MRLLSFRGAPASLLEHNLDQPAVTEALAGQSVWELCADAGAHATLAVRGKLVPEAIPLTLS